MIPFGKAVDGDSRAAIGCLIKELLWWALSVQLPYPVYRLQF